jgi:hypothetical protein
MSQVYSISLKFDYLSLECAKQTLQQRIARGSDEHVNYSLEHYKNDIGLDLDNVHDLVRLIFGGWDARLDSTTLPGWSGWLFSGFNASYGWESVMRDAFEAVAPFLEDGSEIVIDIDEGVDHGVVKDGQAVWLS